MSDDINNIRETARDVGQQPVKEDTAGGGGRPPRYREMDSARSIACFLVLFYHSIIVFPLDLHLIPWCGALHSFIWYVCMPIYFFVSGFVYKPRATYLDYTINRVQRILIPHLVFSFLDMIPRVVPNPFVHELSGSVSEAVLDFVLFGGKDWFMRSFFMVCMIFPFVEKFMKKGFKNTVTCVIISILVFIFNNNITDVFCLNMAGGYFIYFVLGYLARSRREEFRLKLQNGYLALGSFLVMIGVYRLFRLAETFGREPGRAMELCFVAVVIVWALSTSSIMKGAFARFMDFVGRWTLQMYLLDPYALVFTRTLLVYVLGVRNAVVIIAVNFVVDSFLCIFGSVYVLNRYRILRFISGIPEGYYKKTECC